MMLERSEVFPFIFIHIKSVTVFFVFFQLTSKVKSCTPSQQKLTRNGKTDVVDGFDVILEDTILFPDGGGQVVNVLGNVSYYLGGGGC